MATYDAYMLRVWCSTVDGRRQWAGQLEHLPDGSACNFRRPQDLLAHFSDLFDACAPLPHPCAENAAALTPQGSQAATGGLQSDQRQEHVDAAHRREVDERKGRVGM
jgi:hypothetical protein